ncbi:GNAT family N-acetyltransferase [Kitasatospora sp. NPDC058965]|uniref:GNAT family N-acetyltransferase n=1 Tax=Kitasatospora sp. NPDC058965 TaxID=3346682 RepID=UPI0036B46B50
MVGSGVGELVREWVGGWAASRGAAEPIAAPWGWTIDVGQSAQAWRQVLPEPTEAVVRELAGGASVPGAWLKLFAEVEAVRPWLASGWRLDRPAHLMSCRLAPERPAVPTGYRVTTWTRHEVTRVLVRTADGAFAARGQIAVAAPGASAVADQIETAPAHRRRGLGGVVMRTLQNAAHEAGARSGVLVASGEGRALYTSLGWTFRAPMASAWYEPQGPEPGPAS